MHKNNVISKKPVFKENKLDTKTILASDVVEFTESRRKFNSYIGNMGEVIAQEKLSNEGFEVCRWHPIAGDWEKPTIFHHLGTCLRCLYPVENEITVIDGISYHTETLLPENPEQIVKQLNRFFGKKLTNLKTFVDTLGIFPQPNKIRYIPDLVAKKDNEIYIIEIKVNSGTIYTKRQKRKLDALLSAREFDLIPLLIHFELDLKAKNFTAKELK